MEKYTSELTAPGDLSEQHQDWGRTIGTGIVALIVLVAAVNLFTYKPSVSASPYGRVVIPASLIQIGRWTVLLAGLGGCGWVVWNASRQRETTHAHTSLTPHLQQATGYTQQIEQLLQANPSQHQQQLLTQIHTWQQTIETMAQTLADLDQNSHIVRRDLHHLPGVINSLEQKVAAETRPMLRADLEQMLLQRKDQYKALEQLQTTRQRAAIQIERTTAVLGTIYSQLLTYRSTFHVTDYQRLGNNVTNEVHRLQDYLDTLHELAF